MLKSKIKLGFWIIFPVVLGIFLASLATPLMIFLKNTGSEKIFKTENKEAAVVKVLIEDENKYFYVNKDLYGEPKASALAYLVGDLNTGEVILSKNQDQQLPIASISKLMTAYVAQELSDEEDIAQISSGALATEGKNGGLKIGEKIKTLDLVYPLLLESSNDAAEAIAEFFGRDIFIKKMNQVAEKLQMTGTLYEDPSGLSIKNQSTVSDIFKLTGYLNQQKTEKIPSPLQITTLRSYSNKKHSWSNISQFLGKEGYIGGKSGYTNAAKQTVVSLFSVPLGDSKKDIGSRPVAIALLGSLDRNGDVENILKYLKKNVYYGGIADANTDWVKEKIGVPDIREPDFVSFIFAGDIMLDRGVKNSVIKNFNNDYSALFEKLDLLKKSDIVFANLEGTASDKGEDNGNLYSFRMDPSIIPALKGSGISILSVVNNHIGDFGRQAFIDTLSRLEENEILYTGGGISRVPAETPTIVEKYGMKIGFLGFGDNGPDLMEAGENLPGILSANNPRSDEIIKNASKQVDYLVVYFHFGEEYETTHNERQEYLAHRAVDSGAKIVIGSNPHVVQDFEVYKDGYIAYSLGNFIFDQKFAENTMEGMLLEIKLNKDGGMTVKKNTVKLNSAFQPDKIVPGKEEKVKFADIKAE